jgi:hypothetical protein
MPRKEFESFTRLDASDVNTFLMDQSVQSFAGTAARGSAIATPVEGMVTYLNDIDSLSVYNGTAFTTDRTIQVFAGTAARGSAIGTAVEGMYTHINDTDSLEYYNGSAWVAAGPAPSPAGLNLISTGAFTAATAVSFDNVFTSTYQNYRLLITATASAQSTLQMKLRVGGVDSTANYFYVMAHQRTNGTIITPSSGNPGVFAGINIIAASNKAHGVYDIFSPQIATPTDMTFSASSQDPSGPFITTGGFRHNVSTAYDGFTILPNAGNITGKVQLFGYRD